MSDQPPYIDDPDDNAPPGTEPTETPMPVSGADSVPSGEDELDAEYHALAASHDRVMGEASAAESAAAEIERELAGVLENGRDYQELAGVCDTLEGMIDRGALELFWGPYTGQATAREQLDAARAEVEGFRRRVADLEAQHQAALNEVAEYGDQLDELVYGLHEVEQLQESRQREWLVERDEDTLPTRLIAMPWMRGFEDDRRFRNTLVGSLAASLLLGLLIPLIDIPIPERDEVIEIPERFARFIREERQPPLAVRDPVPQETEPQEPEPESEPEEPEVTDKLVPETQVAVAPSEPEPSAKERVASKGILAFRDNFSSLKSSRPAARLGADASLSNEGAAAVGLPQRNMVAAQGSESSGGINLASISRDVGGGGVALSEGVELARVASSIDGGGPNDRPRSAGVASGRTDEEIQIVFDRYKAALYRLYNRALRQDPTLKGQMVLRLTIEPDGSVSLCNVQQSDMGAPDLAQQVASSVSGFQFGPKDVPPVTILYPIDFLPTA